MLRYLTALVAALACLGARRLRAARRRRRQQRRRSSDTLQPARGRRRLGRSRLVYRQGHHAAAFKAGLDAFNEQNPGLNAELIELPEEADQQREQQVQRLRAESDECDVLGMDVIWTAEYAAARAGSTTSPPWSRSTQDEFIASTVETASYEDKIWALPFNTNAGFLYYRTDQVSEPARYLGGRLRAGARQRRAGLPGLGL